jgi:AraC family transcriptional regulator of adaptative response/methylated-DNA-[protein]-cysteine methyltransferase
MPQEIVYKLVDSPVGELIVGATRMGCCLLEFHRPGRWDAQEKKFKKLYDGEFTEGSSPLIRQIEKELKEYFSAKRKRFEIPLDIRGTDFEMTVWKQLLKIPYGELTSYAHIAAKIHNPKSVRAVGTANGSNHIAIIIPCHRVIGSNGSLTGYGGGLDKKRFLIELERGKRLL